jgi:hypothetical protein
VDMVNVVPSNQLAGVVVDNLFDHLACHKCLLERVICITVSDSGSRWPDKRAAGLMGHERTAEQHCFKSEVDH